MNILGINAYHGNASPAIVCDGQLVAAAEEERFNRVKYAAGFPANAVRYCLQEAGVTISEVDHIAVPRNPWARLGTKALYAIRLPRFALGRSRRWLVSPGSSTNWPKLAIWTPPVFARMCTVSSTTGRIWPARSLSPLSSR